MQTFFRLQLCSELRYAHVINRITWLWPFDDKTGIELSVMYDYDLRALEILSLMKLCLE